MRTPLSKVDKLCLIALAGVLVTVALVYELTDGRTVRAAEADNSIPTQEVVEQVPLIVQTLPVEVGPQTAILLPPAEAEEKNAAVPLCTALAEAIEAMKADQYDKTIPLDRTCQTALWETCQANNVPVCLALGLIEVESGFQTDTISSEGCVGLTQLNVRYFPEDLTPAENIQTGVGYLGDLLEKYDGDTQAALTAYNAGHNTGSRTYARAVLDASEKWGNG